MRAPQLEIRNKKLTLNRLFLRDKTILTSVNGPMVFNIVKAFSFAVSFENKVCLRN